MTGTIESLIVGDPPPSYNSCIGFGRSPPRIRTRYRHFLRTENSPSRTRNFAHASAQQLQQCMYMPKSPYRSKCRSPSSFQSDTEVGDTGLDTTGNHLHFNPAELGRLLLHHHGAGRGGLALKLEKARHQLLLAGYAPGRRTWGQHQIYSTSMVHEQPHPPPTTVWAAGGLESSRAPTGSWVVCSTRVRLEARGMEPPPTSTYLRSTCLADSDLAQECVSSTSPLAVLVNCGM